MPGIPRREDLQASGTLTSILSECAERGVNEIVHFTTDRGLLGMMTLGRILSRARLPREKQLEFIVKHNVEVRKDVSWVDHVNLSVGAINKRFFDICSRHWHAGDRSLWWCVMAFDPVVATHDGVWFTTTNNFYPAVRRAQALAGFQAMFGPEVAGIYGTLIRRGVGHPTDLPTDPQAEVLYPKELSLAFLKRACFMTEDHADYYETLCSTLSRHDLAGRAVVDPSAFARTV